VHTELARECAYGIGERMCIWNWRENVHMELARECAYGIGERMCMWNWRENVRMEFRKGHLKIRESKPKLEYDCHRVNWVRLIQIDSFLVI